MLNIEVRDRDPAIINPIGECSINVGFFAVPGGR
jgi:hypothetical protein